MLIPASNQAAVQTALVIVLVGYLPALNPIGMFMDAIGSDVGCGRNQSSAVEKERDRFG